PSRAGRARPSRPQAVRLPTACAPVLKPQPCSASSAVRRPESLRHTLVTRPQHARSFACPDPNPSETYAGDTAVFDRRKAADRSRSSDPRLRRPRARLPRHPPEDVRHTDPAVAHRPPTASTQTCFASDHVDSNQQRVSLLGSTAGVEPKSLRDSLEVHSHLGAASLLAVVEDL